MRILLFSDLHLDDERNFPETDDKRLDLLARTISSLNIDAVVNLGDTVSRTGCLRAGAPGGVESFQRYIKWRKQFSIPFIECCLVREVGFFEEIFGQPADYVRDFGDCAVITLCPMEDAEHLMTPEEIKFLDEAISSTEAKNILICSHVPFPGSCSRKEEPGIFLYVPDELDKVLQKHAETKELFWAGGHFHWAMEAPQKKHGVTSFMGGRFRFDKKQCSQYSYMRIFEDGKIIDLPLE